MSTPNWKVSYGNCKEEDKNMLTLLLILLNFFGFVDKNHDGINDVFVDKDDDGVNDLSAKWEDKDGICDNVIDVDGDRRNDIAEITYTKRNLRGYKLFIIMTAYGTVETAVDAMKKGAYDYLSKPLNLEEPELTIKKGCGKKESCGGKQRTKRTPLYEGKIL